VEEIESRLVSFCMFMVRPERFELPTLWFEAKCSIQLSYGRTSSNTSLPTILHSALPYATEG
jgi:hypothetical protein